MRGFLSISDPWDFAPHLMRSGGATCVVAMRRVLIGGFFYMTLRLPATFQLFGL